MDWKPISGVLTDAPGLHPEYFFLIRKITNMERNELQQVLSDLKQ